MYCIYYNSKEPRTCDTDASKSMAKRSAGECQRFSSCWVESDATKSRKDWRQREVPQRQMARRYSSTEVVTCEVTSTANQPGHAQRKTYENEPHWDKFCVSHSNSTYILDLPSINLFFLIHFQALLQKCMDIPRHNRRSVLRRTTWRAGSPARCTAAPAASPSEARNWGCRNGSKTTKSWRA